MPDDTPQSTDLDDLTAHAEHAVGHAMTTLSFNSSTRSERRSIAEAVIEIAVSAERTRCVAIVQHHMVSHRLTATVHSNPMEVARHEQAAAALETVLERIEDP